MALTALLIASAALVSDEIFSAYKEKYVTTGIKKLLFKPEEYTLQLSKVIIDTIEKYEETYPPVGNFPFYHHKETFAQLSKFILFKDEGKNILESINFDVIENIDKPTREQVEHFYNYFINQIKDDDKLKEFYIEENYKSKIFAIYREISLVKNIIEDFIKNLPQSDTIFKSWIDQIYDNLQKLKNSTALEEINRFETEVLTKNEMSDVNKAFMYFVKGLCLNENMKPKEAIDYFEQACHLNPDNQSYKAWHLYLQYLFNYSDALLDSVKQATKANPFDPLLNGIITMEALNKNHVFTSSGIPLSVQNNIRYKRIVYRYYLTKNLAAFALEYFQVDKEDIDNQLEIVSIDNYGYLDFRLQLYFIKMLDKFPNNLFFESNPELKNSAELHACILYFEKFLDRIKDSEKKTLKALYEYLYKITLFFKEGDKKHLNAAHLIFEKNKEHINPYYFSLLKFGFSQAGDYEATIKLINDKELTEEEHYFKYVLYSKLRDKENAIKSILDYIKNVKNIDNHNITMVLDSVLASNVNFDSLEEFYVSLNNNEIATNGLYKDILIATKGIKNEIHKDISIKILENNFKSICDESFINEDAINNYCRVLGVYKLWEGIATIYDNKRTTSLGSKTLLIESLWHSKLNSTKLLRLLEEFRNSNFPQFEEFYVWEISLNNLIGAWDKVQSIAKMGRNLFHGNMAFDYYLSISYVNLDKRDELCDLIDEIDLLQYKFQNFQTLMQGLLHFNEYSRAVEYIYTYTITSNDPHCKMFFFNAFLFNYEQVINAIPIYCEAGYTVKIESSTKSIFVNEFENKNIFEKLVGKRIGESITLPAPMTGLDIEYKIVSIHHKYDILLSEIQKEAENPELSGIPMQAFTLTEGGTIEEWNKQLIDLFGKSGDERSIFIEKTISQYKANSLSFLQLTRSMFDDDLLKAYLAVTNSPQVGFRIISSSLFKKINPNELDKVCLDLPTLILLSEQAKKINIPNNKKYIISEYSVNYVEGLLQIIENSKESNLSLNITSKGVIPFSGKKDNNDEKKTMLRQCRAWIDDNCEILTSTNKLDFLVQFQKDNTTPNSLVLSYLDTISLAIEHQKVLISDEKIALPVLQSSNLLASSEWYLRNCIEQYDSDSLYELLSSRNYIGIEIPSSKINEVTNILINRSSDQENILHNFSIKNSANTSNVLILAKVMEEILNSSSEESKKVEIINILFSNLLEDLYSNENLIQDVIHLVKLSLFELFYKDKSKYQFIINKLYAVLSANNVRISMSNNINEF